MELKFHFFLRISLFHKLIQIILKNIIIILCLDRECLQHKIYICIENKLFITNENLTSVHYDYINFIFRSLFIHLKKFQQKKKEFVLI